MSSACWMQLVVSQVDLDDVNRIFGGAWEEEYEYEVGVSESNGYRTCPGVLMLNDVRHGPGQEELEQLRGLKIPYFGYREALVREFGPYCFAFDGETSIEMPATSDGDPVVVAAREGVYLEDVTKAMEFHEVQARALQLMQERHPSPPIEPEEAEEGAL